MFHVFDVMKLLHYIIGGCGGEKYTYVYTTL